MGEEHVIELCLLVDPAQLGDRRDRVGDAEHDGQAPVVGAATDRPDRQRVRRDPEPTRDRRQRLATDDDLVRPVRDRWAGSSGSELDTGVPRGGVPSAVGVAFRSARHVVRAWHTVSHDELDYQDAMRPDVTTWDVAAWDRLVLRSPETALEQALALLPSATDARAGLTLQYAAGRAQFELGRIVDASSVFRSAVEALDDVDVDADVHHDVGRSVLMTAAVVFAESGAIDEALDSLDAVAERCEGVELGRVWLQRGVVLLHAGRPSEALAALDHSDRIFAAAADERDRLRLHQNRGVVLLQQGDLGAAEADLLAAIDLARRLGMTAAEGQCHANAGALYGRARRLVDALAAFDRADRLLDEAGRPDRVAAWLEIDRAEVMMHFGLVDDAVAAARRALLAAEPSGNAALVGDALMMRAQTELRAGQLREASRTADAAREQLRASGRHDMVGHAEGIAVRAELRRASHDDRAVAFDRSAELLSRLRRLGWHEQADELATERLRAAWRLDAWDAVVEDLAELRLHAWGDRRDLALLGWFAEAVARQLAGDGRGSIEACTTGLGFLDDITAEASDLEARSAAMRLGRDLSRWIIEVAIGLHVPDLVLAASEGTRARALHEELDGQDRHRPLTDAGAERLRAELANRLSGRSLVQWIVSGDRVHAVVCDDHQQRLVDVADVRSVVRELDRATAWLDRAAGEPGGPSDRARRASMLLDEMLVGPLDLDPDRSVVIVPVDELHGVPWSGLPSLAARPVLLAPSCRIWLDADRRGSIPLRSVGFVAGPNVAADDIERTTLRRCFDRVDEATGAGATAATVRTMFSGHDVVHVAAHGRFRSDRPLLSTLELAEGDVTLHQTVPVRVGARLAVLSSCEGGAHGGNEGSEVLGLASVLLARGAASVLAPLTVVRDLECGEFVAAVHEEMALGTAFGLAVARIRSAWLGDDVLSRWAVASSFSCFGSGATHWTDG